MKSTYKISLKIFLTTLSLGVLAACGDGKESFIRDTCKQEMDKNPKVASLPKAQQEMILNMCIEEATKALKNN